MRSNSLQQTQQVHSFVAFLSIDEKSYYKPLVIYTYCMLLVVLSNMYYLEDRNV